MSLRDARPPILFAAAPEVGRLFTDRWRGVAPAFYCVLAHTETCLIPGLSAAGVSEELRPLTPAADAEVVLLGSPRCLGKLPSNPLGAAGPAGITRAALELAGIQAVFVGAGLRVWPQTPCLRVSDRAGANIVAGCGVPNAPELLEAGVELGQSIGRRHPFVVLGESVPGGTTTALALLLALGYAAEGRVSGSQTGNGHALKTRVARSALRAAGLDPGEGLQDPLRAAGKVGDPMQPLVAGMLRGAHAAGAEILLAGGSQMLAVAALARALDGPASLERVAIGTTRWVVEDTAADVAGLAADISTDLPVLAANLNFARSRHAALVGYESFLVKEGVGAGGACIAALLATGEPIERLERRIDQTYDRLLAAWPNSADLPGTPCV